MFRHGKSAVTLQLTWALAVLGLGWIAWWLQRPWILPQPGHSPRRRVLALLISGAGGWLAFDQELASGLRQAGFDVLGIDAQKYFLWQMRKPGTVTAFITSCLVSWSKHWGDARYLLIGYSQGADIMPFVVARMHPGLQERVRLIALLGPADRADFRLRLRDLIFGTYSDKAQALAPELQKLPVRIPVLCIHGREDKRSLCPSWVRDSLLVRPIQGGHIFRHNADEILRIIVQAWNSGSDIARL